LVINTLLDSKDDPESERVLESLENIDDDCDRNGIILVRTLIDFWFFMGT
jgi:hypothetical protein